MDRFFTLVGLALALSACDAFRDYRVDVNDPTRRDVVTEQPYYDYGKRDTIHPRSGSNR